MKTVLYSASPFCVGSDPRPVTHAEMREPGVIAVRHLPRGEKTFAGYLLDLRHPSPELCRVLRTADGMRAELFPVPLSLPETCVFEQTFPLPDGTGAVRIYRRAGCFRAELEGPGSREYFVPSPLAGTLRAEVLSLGRPAVLLTADDRIALFGCEEEFPKLLDCRAFAVRHGEDRLSFTRVFADSRKRAVDLSCAVTADFRLEETRLAERYLSSKRVFPELTPLYFAESVAAGFEDEARSYLAPDLAGTDFGVMRDYFGFSAEPADVLWLDGKIGIHTRRTLRTFSFELREGKISNFSDE